MDITEAAPGVHLVQGRDVNWTILAEGERFTLVDAGYPGYADDVRESITHLGLAPSGLAAVLVTHAHIDHLGGVPALVEGTDVPVYLSAAEARLAHGDAIESAGTLDVVRRLHRHGVLPWSLRISRAGATKHVVVPRAEAFPRQGALDLPGRPVPIATPGHTTGHTAYWLPEAHAVITGDALCTSHPTSRIDGPQLLPSFFDHDRAGAIASLEVLAGLDADVMLPGHGPVHRGPIADAVRAALA